MPGAAAMNAGNGAGQITAGQITAGQTTAGQPGAGQPGAGQSTPDTGAPAPGITTHTTALTALTEPAAPTDASPAAPVSVPLVPVSPATIMALAPVALAASPAAAPAAPSAQPAAVPAPLATQVAGPIFSLAAAGKGEHVMTINVTPDNLGPVTVRAHVSAEGVRVEMFALSDQARDALRGIMTDLRRDLQSSGLNASLDLSARDAPDPGDRGTERGSVRDGQGREARDRAGRAPGSPSGSPPGDADIRFHSWGSPSTIDVLA